MSRPAKFTIEVIAAAQQGLNEARTIAELRAAQSVLLPALYGLSREQTATAIGLSTSRVGSLQAEARRPVPRVRQAHGGRRRQRMTLEQERAFLAPWEEQARSAGMIIVPPLHAALEEHLGKPVHHSQVYRMLARHDWRKVAPDSTHPKTDAGAQEAWKKNSRKWYPKR